MRVSIVAVALTGLFLASASPALAADSWFPHDKGATWTYSWTNDVYSETETRETVSVKTTKGRAFTLQWSTLDEGNAPDAVQSVGEMTFQDSASGLINTGWASNPAPPDFPILCPVANGCNNSLASTLYMVIWGGRSPVLALPLLEGRTWRSAGGAQGDVTSTSDYVGTAQIKVPAFEKPVTAAKIRTEITQAGALGDPFGSGVRTVWWVYGVGPVRVDIQHAGSEDAVTTSVLVSTNQKAQAPPSDTRWFPLEKDTKVRYRWANTKWLKKASVQEFTIDQAANESARFTVKDVSGPVRVAGSYGFTTRGDGVTNLWGTTQSATLAKFPALGPSDAPAKRRNRFVTPFDLMIYGFNPLIPASPAVGEKWSAKQKSRDFSVFGVTGTATVIGIRPVTVPAGAFQSLAVRTELRQEGFNYGSGTRTCYFAAGKGLVKLVFEHDDGSVSTVELLK